MTKDHTFKACHFLWCLLVLNLGFARRICQEFKNLSIGGSEAIVKTHTPHVCRGSSLNFGGGAFYLNNPCEKETD